MSKEKYYTPTEVGALIERFETRLSVVAEEVSGFSAWRMKTDSILDNIESDVRIIKDVIRIEIPSLRTRVTILERKTS